MTDINDKSFCVYQHTFPDSSIYIGRTGDRPECRWRNVFGYETHRKLFAKIVAVGWDNIKHEILYDGLTEMESVNKERELIEKVRRETPGKVLNTTYARVEKPRSFELPLTEETIRRYPDYLVANRDDYWLEYYKHFFNCFPFDEVPHIGYVELTWYFMMPEKKVDSAICRIYYPGTIKTFSELHRYLMEKEHEVEWVKKRREPILLPAGKEESDVNETAAD